MSGELATRDGGTALERASSWATLPDDELRRRAALAATERDPDALWALTEAFLTVHGARGTTVSRYTVRNYERGVRDLLEAWPHVNLLRPPRDAAQLWIRSLEEHLAAGTVRLKIAAARTLYKALRWSGATTATPFIDTKAPHDPVQSWEKRKEYTRHHLEQLLATGDPFDRATVLLGAHAGLRISEIAALQWQHVDLLANELRVTGKGGKASTVSMTPALAHAIEALPQQGDKVLPWRVDYLRDRFRRLCERARVPYKGRAFHGLRHSAGTLLLEVTGDLAMVADHMRHSSTDTTRTYAKRNREKLIAALERL